MQFIVDQFYELPSNTKYYFYDAQYSLILPAAVQYFSYFPSKICQCLQWLHCVAASLGHRVGLFFYIQVSCLLQLKIAVPKVKVYGVLLNNIYHG